MVRGIPAPGGRGRLKPGTHPGPRKTINPNTFYNMNMTIPGLVNRLRSYVVWFDTSKAEILIDGKPIKSFDYELEPVLPPDGFERRMERLNISTKKHVGETHRIVRVKMLAMPAEDNEFDNAAKEQEKVKWEARKDA